MVTAPENFCARVNQVTAPPINPTTFINYGLFSKRISGGNMWERLTPDRVAGREGALPGPEKRGNEGRKPAVHQVNNGRKAYGSKTGCVRSSENSRHA